MLRNIEILCLFLYGMPNELMRMNNTIWVQCAVNGTLLPLTVLARIQGVSLASYAVLKAEKFISPAVGDFSKDPPAFMRGGVTRHAGAWRVTKHGGCKLAAPPKTRCTRIVFVPPKMKNALKIKTTG